MRALVLLLASLLLLPLPALAQQQPPGCLPIAKLKADAAERYGEHMAFAGTSVDDVNIVLVFTSPSLSFTVALLNPSGIACVVAAGESWHALPQTKPQVPEAAP